MEITRKSKLLDVLKAYPALEEQIIEIAPPFKNLRNPVLRRTVGQLATIENVAQIGGLEVTDLVNRLRRLAGLSDLPDAPSGVTIPTPSAGAPDWLTGEPSAVVDGNALLNEGQVPLERVNELLAGLPTDGYLLLVTDFEPTPIIEAMRKQRRRVHHAVGGAGGAQHLTYIA